MAYDIKGTTYNLVGDNRFKIEGFTYPSDLMDPTAKYGGNYVMFRINVHQDSFLTNPAKYNAGGFFAPGELPPSKRGEVAGLSEKQLVTAAGVGAAVTAAGGVKAFGSGSVESAVGAAAVGVAITATAVNTLGSLKKEYKTQKTAIALYMPGDLAVKYGAAWEETSFDSTMQAIGVGTAVVEAAMQKSTAPLKGAGSAITAAALATPGMGQVAGKSSGTAANPKKEQLFKNVDYRTFTFSYQFFPRSADEAQSVLNIIRQFKLHMHPEFRDPGTNFLYIYPSEFDITYYTNGHENTALHKHTSCVLTDLSISYAPQGTFTAFNTGVPTQINVQMTFKELAIITKEDILQGY